MKKRIPILLLAVGCNAYLFAEINIPPTDPHIYFQGCRYTRQTDSGMMPMRFPGDLLKRGSSVLNFYHLNARYPSSTRLLFSSSSSNITATVTVLSNTQRTDRITLRLYKDGQVLRDYQLERKPEDITLDMEIRSPGKKPHLYQIDFPIQALTIFNGIALPDGQMLDEVQFPEKPVYVALGDSITQGSVGLDGLSAASYPYLLAEKLGYDLYNLGVGGSRVSPVIGEMLADWNRIDLITLLIGYNDLSWAGHSLSVYRDRYLKLIQNIRKSHHETPLFCITLTYTRLQKSSKSGITPDEYRQAAVEVVNQLQKAGDKKIFLAHGEQLTSNSDLEDNVHLNTNGCRNFSKNLYKLIQKELN